MNFPDQIRKIIIEKSKTAGVGHIGSGLSIADLIGILYQDILRINDFSNPERDRFILSKGHAALALYAALYLKGFISENELNSYCTDGTTLGVHPKPNVKGVEFATGSLGQGITFAVGSALAAKIQSSQRKIYCLISDAELNEGSFWEAIMFAAHHKLENLVVILDLNGQQALGLTDEIIKITEIDKKLASFGWESLVINGHNPSEIKNCFNNINFSSAKPHFITAKTISGYRVSFMEKSIPWHYKSMNDEEYKLALKELNQ